MRAEGATPLAGRAPFHQKGYASLGRLLHPVRVSIVARRHRTKPLRNGPPSTKSGLDSRPAVTTRGRNGAEGPPSLTRPQFHDLYGIVGPRERGRRAESCTRATVGLRSCRTCAELVRTISFQTGVLQNLNHFSRTRATWSSPFVARVRNWFETFPSELGLCGITTVFRALVRRGPFPCCTCADAAEADQPRPPTAAMSAVPRAPPASMIPKRHTLGSTVCSCGTMRPLWFPPGTRSRPTRAVSEPRQATRAPGQSRRTHTKCRRTPLGKSVVI